MGIQGKRVTIRFQLFVRIPPTRFELVSPDPKSCMIDRYTTGVFNDMITKFGYLPIFRKDAMVYMHFRTIRIALSSIDFLSIS